MIEATFETVTLADAIGRAARHAPTKGSALDRSAGVLLELPEEGSVTVRATDLLVFYRQQVGTVDRSGGPVAWRLPSVVFAAVMGTMPSHMGSTITLTDKGDGFVYLECGAVTGRINQIGNVDGFPRWDPFDPEGMSIVEGMAERLAQVGWAVEKKGDGLLTGVHIDGEYLWATDRNAVARVPLPVPVPEAVTAPLDEILPLVRNHPEVALRATENRLQLLVEDDTQVELALIYGEYPRMGPFVERDMPHVLELHRTPVLNSLERLRVLAHGERYPVVKVEFHEGGGIRMTMDMPDVGVLVEELDGLPCKPFTFAVTPEYLIGTLTGARAEKVVFSHGDDPFGPFRVEDEHGYVCVTMPRRVE